MAIKKFTALLTALALLSGCGGGNSSSGGASPPPPPASASAAAGIWFGTETPSGSSVFGVIDGAGDVRFVVGGNAQYSGSVTMSGDSASANIEGFASFPNTFADGSIHGAGAVSGTVSQGVSAQLTNHFTTDAGAAASGSIALEYEKMYDQPSSLAAIAGNYTDSATQTVVSINSDGAITAQDPSSGCIINGTISVIDPAHAAYRVSLTPADCAGPSAVLNGIMFTGLAAAGDIENARILAMVSGTGQSGAKYGLIFWLY